MKMTKDKRISSVFNNAKKIEITNESKIVIMSDVHRGVGDHSDNFSKNENIFLSALNSYYRKGYTYIELGDGDELWKNNKFNEIKKEHLDVFLLIRKFYIKNRFYTVYGNHDIAKRSPRWCRQNLASYYDDYHNRFIPLFKKSFVIPEGIILYHKESGKELHLLHGHQGDRLNDKYWRISKFLVRYLWRPLELIGIKNPSEPSDNAVKNDMIEKHLIRWSEKHDKVLIAGHTHRPKFPKISEPMYFNDGSCVSARTITAIEIDNGNIFPVEWGVFSRSNGTLYIKKRILKQPHKISDL